MIRVLFICHGNICRSAAAEYVMKQIVKREGREEDFAIDSAGTSAEELGNPMYPPMRKVLKSAGVGVGDHRARRMRRDDYDNFDLLVGMDSENRYNMNRMWPKDPEGKLRLLMDYTDRPGDVSDPWYTRDFEQAYRDIREGCEALFLDLQSQGLC